MDQQYHQEKEKKHRKKHPLVPIDRATQAQMDEVAKTKADDAKANAKVKNTIEEMDIATRKIFALYKNLLGKCALIKWNKIVATQIRRVPWTDLNGHINNTPHAKMLKSFKDCVKFHLLTIFSQDTAEHHIVLHQCTFEKACQSDHLSFCGLRRTAEQLPWSPSGAH